MGIRKERRGRQRMIWVDRKNSSDGCIMVSFAEGSFQRGIFGEGSTFGGWRVARRLVILM